MTVSKLEDHIGYWLRSISNAVSQTFAQKLQASGVTVAEWVILREMYDRTGTAPSYLAEATGLTRGAISKLVDRLLEKKLLARAYDKDDRRYQALSLTESGRQLVPKLAAIADRNDEEFFAPLSPKKRERLLNTLRKLSEAHNFKNHPIE